MTQDSIQRAQEIAKAAAEKKAGDIVILHVGPIIGITDYFVICSANNERQVATIVDAIEEQIRKAHAIKPYRREGERELRWVLLDYLDVVVHVMHQEEREFYELERLWKDAKTIPLPDSATGALA